MNPRQRSERLVSPRARPWHSMIGACAALSMLSYLISALHAGQPKTEPLDVARDAARSSVQGLRSGKGSGTYEFYEQRMDRDKPTLVHTAKMSVWFDADGKYHVRLDFEISPNNNLERQIIIYDGSVIWSSRFWPKEIPHPTGSQGYINALEGKSTKPPSVVGFPWDVSKLPRHALDLDALLKRAPRDAVKMAVVDGKGYRATYRVGVATTATFDMDQAAGFNIVRLSVQNDDENYAVQRNEATWKKAGDLWYVASAVHEYDLRRSDIPFRRWVMKYDKFEPNARVPANFFSWEALELRPGSRILDQRPVAPQPEYRIPKRKT